MRERPPPGLIVVISTRMEAGDARFLGVCRRLGGCTGRLGLGKGVRARRGRGSAQAGSQPRGSAEPSRAEVECCDVGGGLSRLIARPNRRSFATTVPRRPSPTPLPSPYPHGPGWARRANAPNRFEWHTLGPRRRPAHAAVASKEGAAGTVMESSRAGCRGANLRGSGPWRGTTSRVGPRGVPFVSFCRKRRAAFCGAAGSPSSEPRAGGAPPSAQIGLGRATYPPESRSSKRSGAASPAPKSRQHALDPAGPGARRRWSELLPR
jgi:hypothetical protein